MTLKMEFKNIAQKDCEFDGIKLYNPTVSELSEIFSHEEDLFFILKLFYIPLSNLFDTKTQNVTEFQIFQTLLITPQAIEGFTIEKKKSILEFLLLIFKDYELKMNEQAFIFHKQDQIFILNNRNFNEFKNSISKMFGTKEFLKDKKEEVDFNPSDARAKAIADKIMRGRKVAAEQKGIDTKHSKGIIENYISILSIGLKIPSSILCEKLSFYNMVQMYKRYVAKMEWELDIKQRLAGGDPENSPDFWMNFY